VLVAPSVAAPIVRGGIIGIELYRSVEVGDGAVRIALGAPGIAAAVVGVSVLRIELDRLVVIRNGVNVVVLVAIAVAAIVEGDREVLVRFLAD
jgi:hypothetical protein